MGVTSKKEEGREIPSHGGRSVLIIRPLVWGKT